MKKILGIFLALAVALSLMLMPAAVSANPGTVSAGINDNFVLPTEPTSPSADLLLLMDPYGGGNRVLYPHRQFDDVHIDRVFGHTFTGLPPCIVAATLEIHMFAGGSSLTSNDALHLERTGVNDASTSWGMGLSALFNAEWSAGTDHTFILDLANLPPDGEGDTNIIPFMNADHALDVYVQDDTGVDYMILTVETLCVVDIDIKPGSDPNSINLNGNGVVPVGVFGTATFDVNDINVGTVRFGVLGTEAAAVHSGHIEDLNGDGIDDMVLHFREGELGIDVNTPGNTTLDLLLTGELDDGSAFEGKDEVRITPNNPDKSRGKGGKGPK